MVSDAQIDQDWVRIEAPKLLWFPVNPLRFPMTLAMVSFESGIKLHLDVELYTLVFLEFDYS